MLGGRKTNSSKRIIKFWNFKKAGGCKKLNCWGNVIFDTGENYWVNNVGF